MRTRNEYWGAVLLVIGLTASGCSLRILRGYAAAESESLRVVGETAGPMDGAARLAFDDLTALTTDAMDTHAMPWKVLVAAVLGHRRDVGLPGPLREEAVFPLLKQYGFVLPDTILNVDPAFTAATRGVPFGLIRGVASRRVPRVEVELVNLGCAACHAGVTYDAKGDPRMDAWLGLPNTSIHLDAFSRTLYEGLLWAIEHPHRFEITLDSIYPAMAAAERQTIHRYVLPAIAERLPGYREAWDGLTPYAPGGPGTANGLGALRHVLGLYHAEGERIAVGAAVSIPDFGDRVLKSSLTTDGGFGIPEEPRFQSMRREDLTPAHLDGKAGVVAFFGVPTMGLEPERVNAIVPRFRQIVDFMADYRPPSFPGKVDLGLAAEGEAAFADRCSGCHGDYRPLPDVRLERYPNVVVPARDIGTDPMRWEASEPWLAEIIEGSAAGNLVALSPTEGYMAPPLTGVWATAPYLHNGSVPTLWHLMHSEARPEHFEVGGHRLDFRRVGIDGEIAADGVYRYPGGYSPWSQPAIYDTTDPGRSNGGHEAPFEGMTDREKDALLEYLKLL